MNSKCPIAGYSFGEASINASPVSLEELHELEAAIGWSDDDVLWLRMAAETLVPQAEAMVDSWRAVIGLNSQRHSLALMERPTTITSPL